MSDEEQRAQVRTVRRWILLAMGVGLAVLVVWAFASNNSTSAPVATAADEAACATLASGLDAVSAGTPLTAAMGAAMNGGWPAGQPSDAVRGVFNEFRAAVAAEGDYLAGVGTFDDATESFAGALESYRSTCVN